MNNDKREPCCELCRVFDYGNGKGYALKIVCKDPSCPCHQSGEKEETLVEGWVRAFREKFGCKEENCCEGKKFADYFYLSEMEGFIHKTLSQERQKAMDRLVKEIEKRSCDAGDIFTGYVVSLSDVLYLLQDTNKKEDGI